METRRFIVAYDGEALKNHEMDIQELAVALTGIADTIKAAGSLLNCNDTKISVKVSSFNSGSFEILLSASQHISSILGFLGTNPQILGLGTIIGLLGFAGLSMPGVIQFIKQIKDGRVESITEDETGDNITVNYVSNNTKQSIIINKSVYLLCNDSNVMNNLNKIIKPLEKVGIDSFEIRNENKEVIESINKEDVKYFEFKPQDHELTVSEVEMWLNLVSISFKEGNKWKLSSGADSDFYATIADEEFLTQVNNNSIKFSKSDSFKALVRIEQKLTADGIKTFHTVLKVLEYKSATQMRLDFYKKD